MDDRASDTLEPFPATLHESDRSMGMGMIHEDKRPSPISRTVAGEKTVQNHSKELSNTFKVRDETFI